MAKGPFVCVCTDRIADDSADAKGNKAFSESLLDTDEICYHKKCQFNTIQATAGCKNVYLARDPCAGDGIVLH